ncbi:MAG: hypothetical protein Q9219_004053 [cf. Caloplaca sp. 3 TL-2023]
MAKPAGQKRQAAQADIDTEDRSRRTRSKPGSEETVNKSSGKRTTRSSDQSKSSSDGIEKDNEPRKATTKKGSKVKPPAEESPNIKKKIVKKGTAQKVVGPKKTSAPKTIKDSKSSSRSRSKAEATLRRSSSNFSEVAIASRSKNKQTTTEDAGAESDDDANGPSYWLMKAEPESRIEKGKDVKFSIDDLKNAKADAQDVQA